jgi:KaiC/GvpD/RAD55 family RecA-like ATPase
MEVLLAGLRDAMSGRGAFFLLGGEPGIGKTKLADEFAVRAEAEGAFVLWGR